MKILGAYNERWFISSIGRHDYVNTDGLMIDGGIPGCGDYAGYNRHNGTLGWAQVPQTFAELFTDYRMAVERKYGIWPIKDVKILEESQYPDTESHEWKMENCVWGTRGKQGSEDFKFIRVVDAETDHLQAILDTQQPLRADIQQIIVEVLEKRSKA